MTLHLTTCAADDTSSQIHTQQVQHRTKQAAIMCKFRTKEKKRQKIGTKQKDTTNTHIEEREEETRTQEALRGGGKHADLSRLTMASF